MIAGLHPSFDGLAGSVFSVTAPREEMVVVQEVRGARLPGEELARLAHTVRHHLSRQAGVGSNIVFVAPGQVLRTTSGKVQRAAMKHLFLAGGLRPLYADVAPSLQRHLDAIAVR
jgi:hypothetical protein